MFTDRSYKPAIHNLTSCLARVALILTLGPVSLASVACGESGDSDGDVSASVTSGMPSGSASPSAGTAGADTSGTAANGAEGTTGNPSGAATNAGGATTGGSTADTSGSAPETMGSAPGGASSTDTSPADSSDSMGAPTDMMADDTAPMDMDSTTDPMGSADDADSMEGMGPMGGMGPMDGEAPMDGMDTMDGMDPADDGVDMDTMDDEGGGSEGSAGASAGCGTSTTLSSGNGTIDVGGTQREYILNIPGGYDSSQPYKLIFGLHWLGGSMNDVATGGTVGLGNYYGLEDIAQGSAIFIAPNGIDNGWANSGGRDIEFMKALVELLSTELCIDLDRIFSAGFSYGGMMSFAIACEMADTFRAIAPLSGALYSGCGNGTEPIAMWGAHGTGDTVVPIGDGESGLAEVLARNNCGDQTMPIDPSPCVSYQGCDEGYPVTWCEFDGGHSPLGWQSQPIWDFFSQF